jgi:hypothetical protein
MQNALPRLDLISLFFHVSVFGALMQVLLYRCFTAALLLRYFCFTAALLLLYC